MTQVEAKAREVELALRVRWVDGHVELSEVSHAYIGHVGAAWFVGLELSDGFDAAYTDRHLAPPGRVRVQTRDPAGYWGSSIDRGPSATLQDAKRQVIVALVQAGWLSHV